VFPSYRVFVIKYLFLMRKRNDNYGSTLPKSAGHFSYPSSFELFPSALTFELSALTFELSALSFEL